MVSHSVLMSISCVFIIFFFFSSRRRHTRCLSDWSSDVCSSDLSEVETATFDYDGELINVTISLGAASLQRSDVMQSLIARADEHLHEAKQQGRNRVVALA